MSLLDDFAHPCVLMEKKRVPDGAGGYIVEWTDKTTGETYRVTSNPEDKKAPRSSTLPLKYFTAERWALTT